MKISLPYFEKIQFEKDKIELMYSAVMPYQDEKIELDLAFDYDEVQISDFEIIGKFFEQFDEKINCAKNLIVDDYNRNGITKEYIQSHLDAFTLTGKLLLKETLAKSKELDRYFLDELHLYHIFFFPDTIDEFICLNFHISDEITDEILVVVLNPDFNVQEIRIEYK